MLSVITDDDQLPCSISVFLSTDKANDHCFLFPLAIFQNVTKKFAKGSKVEVTSNDDGFHGAWFQGTALKYVNNKILVEYDALKADDEITPLTEAIEVQHVRPCPPDIPVTSGFNLLDEVDACWNDGWWVGVISKVNSGDRYMVYFRSSTEETEFGHEQLRLHCDWVGGRWMRASLGLEA
jgi:hypothetical protein